jgi:three-Cys-motif partner protein
MKEESAIDFFKKKRKWSKYKDLILDYYLKPYLAKVLTLGRKVVIVDCCAGPGKFDDGEMGSPLIIGNILSEYYKKGADVVGYFIEQIPFLFDRLEGNLSSIEMPYDLRNNTFKNCINDIAALSKTCTVFLYIDPFEPSCLYFDDLKIVYDRLREDCSVETLINFMSTSFYRGIIGPQKHSIEAGFLENTPQLDKWNSIAGGDYWQEHILNTKLSTEEKIESIASGYSAQLEKWFRWTLRCPIKEKYDYDMPKYHLVFGSRSHHAIDLMNRAMVKARRDFVGARFTKGFLFDTRPQKEVIDPSEIRKIVIRTLEALGKCKWFHLRTCITVAHPGLYTDSEINNAIKNAIREGNVKATCDGKKIIENEFLWL